MFTKNTTVVVHGFQEKALVDALKEKVHKQYQMIEQHNITQVC